VSPDRGITHAIKVGYYVVITLETGPDHPLQSEVPFIALAKVVAKICRTTASRHHVLRLMEGDHLQATTPPRSLKLVDHDAEDGYVVAREQPRRLLGQILIEMNLISERQLEQALEAQQDTGQFLGEILIAHGWLTRTALGDALRLQRDLLSEPDPGLGGGIHARQAVQTHQTTGRPAGTWLAQGPTDSHDR
jgi:hypothetical protein